MLTYPKISITAKRLPTSDPIGQWPMLQLTCLNLGCDNGASVIDLPDSSGTTMALGFRPEPGCPQYGRRVKCLDLQLVRIRPNKYITASSRGSVGDETSFRSGEPMGTVIVRQGEITPAWKNALAELLLITASITNITLLIPRTHYLPLLQFTTN
ncbi:unnamed protein product [Protopolystoma xenopodis]|uniref:Uncharacterized protein n=1 Tax=Protopolystoma xenopodis TaxID=117903 RepID=A0A3S5CN66_9PLAT|nr:unnamed protein product [Protopolystoma xenopodis]